MITEIENLEKELYKDDPKKIELEENKKKIEKMIATSNRFDNEEDSPFIISMKEGGFILFDGIENAQ